MGARGSLHFSRENSESVIKAICEEYSKLDSPLNSDKNHNTQEKPFMVVSEHFISIYDGSFACCGGLFSEAELLSNRANTPVMGIVNNNGNYADLIVVNNKELLTQASFVEEEWLDMPDVEMIMKSMSLPFDHKSVEHLFCTESVDVFLEKFHKLMLVPYFIYKSIPTNYYELQEETIGISIYRQTAPYEWD